MLQRNQFQCPSTCLRSSRLFKLTMVVAGLVVAWVQHRKSHQSLDVSCKGISFRGSCMEKSACYGPWLQGNNNNFGLGEGNRWKVILSCRRRAPQVVQQFRSLHQIHFPLKVCVNKELVLIHMLFPWENCKQKIKDIWFIKGISLSIVSHFCVSQEHEDSGLRCCNSASLKNLPLLWKKLSAVDWLDQLLLSLILDIITDLLLVPHTCPEHILFYRVVLNKLQTY